jgi:hypothetical protein
MVELVRSPVCVSADSPTSYKITLCSMDGLLYINNCCSLEVEPEASALSQGCCM